MILKEMDIGDSDDDEDDEELDKRLREQLTSNYIDSDDEEEKEPLEQRLAKVEKDVPLSMTKKPSLTDSEGKMIGNILDVVKKNEESI